MSDFTPMIKQYLEIKEQYKDCILLYRVGDFYETFFEDAEIASRVLNIVLTGKDCGKEDRAPMAGIPYHAAESYIIKLVDNGYKVAICEQLEDPSKAKGLVKRDVVRVVTPGTIISDNLVGNKDSNYLSSIYIDGENASVSSLDVSTGDTIILRLTNDIDYIYDEIVKINPSEILLPRKLSNTKLFQRLNNNDRLVELMLDDEYDLDRYRKQLLEQYGDNTDLIDKFDNVSLMAFGALLNYVLDTLKISNLYLKQPEFETKSKYMEIDNFTRRNLELVESIRSNKNGSTLLNIIDRTKTAMGGRLLKRYILNPLYSVNEIKVRLEAVEEIIIKKDLLNKFREHLAQIYDIERLLGKLNYNNANPRDLIALKESLKVLPDIFNTLCGCESDLFNIFKEEIDTLDDIYLLIDKAIVDDPPNTLKDGGIIKTGYNDEIDKLHYLTLNSKKLLMDLEQKEREKTGIKSLKIGYNKVFGYYIEVTTKNLNLVPSYYIRKQTLANCERFITEELKRLESDITEAEIKLTTLEYQLFMEIRNKIISEIDRIQKTVFVIAYLDVIQSYAYVSIENNYVKPEINNGDKIIIKNGRHPVIEKLDKKNLFVANDVNLDNENNLIYIITGPNMAGKSTYMRQVALIVIMAQMGCFVPADHAIIGVVDKVFTRVGASDDISSGQSTFMVEMNEVAYILKNATSKSLIILDEIGRGTSTFDGLSIAWAVIEYISIKIKAKTLFATHYHELVKLEDELPNVKNFYVSIYKNGDDIVFLRKIMKGSMSQSFGIQVAKMAGVPEEVINKAKRLLKSLERSEKNFNKIHEKSPATQLDIFSIYTNKIVELIKNIDINTMTPLDALNKLNEIKNLLTGGDQTRDEQNKNIG
ncbi:DNA mismatch repair protein MutS [Calorimonas adulescens]|uniref:DNA mismatch repair protein MutS n=1 Tax=Calorimonas adulescens TaxID=2606906 RepID=A0A5D8Q9E7_9THEO|nr:DNA mismatch repair protein MutS [Calorimonas adulescens]TZE80804.1 DNA mismatch repair protein MutS [Calorimonas adulescens]